MGGPTGAPVGGASSGAPGGGAAQAGTANTTAGSPATGGTFSNGGVSGTTGGGGVSGSAGAAGLAGSSSGGAVDPGNLPNMMPQGYTGTPFGGTPQTIPGKIPAAKVMSLVDRWDVVAQITAELEGRRVGVSDIQRRAKASR